MNTQTMISYLQNSVDKRSDKIKQIWEIYVTYSGLKIEAKTNAPDCIGYWNNCRIATLKQIKDLEQKQKIEKKILRTLISTKRMLKQEVL